MEREVVDGWIAAAQNGDARAFENLAAKYRRIALAAARRWLRPDAAEDAVQDALIIAFRSISQLECPERFPAWFAAIVRNRCRRILSQTANVASLEAMLATEPRVPIALIQLPTEPPPLDWGNSVGCLVAPMRDIFELYYRHEFSVGDIATYLEMPVTTVKWQLHAGRTILKRKLQEKSLCIKKKII